MGSLLHPLARITHNSLMMRTGALLHRLLHWANHVFLLNMLPADIMLIHQMWSLLLLSLVFRQPSYSAAIQGTVTSTMMQCMAAANCKAHHPSAI